MIGLLKEPLFFLTATLLLYSAASWLYRRLGLLFLQPVLLTVVLMILFLALTGIEYESYMEGGKIIHFFLGPSVVALGVPLYLRSTELRKEFGAIAVSLLFGSLTGIISVVPIPDGGSGGCDRDSWSADRTGGTETLRRCFRDTIRFCHGNSFTRNRYCQGS